MFSNGIFVLIMASLMFISAARAQITQVASESSQSPDSSDIFYICKRFKDVRWLRAYKLENGKCKSLYSKEGYLQVISSATYFSSCEGVLVSGKKNLEEGNFKCTQMAKASVIDLESEQ